MCIRDSDSNLDNISALGAWAGIISYAIQIYFDFSGYSDMAIGLGHIFGFKYMENFNYPYISKSVTEFWKRWHISLTTFFREYVYIPLGGNRKHHVVNLFIIWFLTGMWHGASWNFIIWGLYYFIFIVVEKLFLGDLLEKCPKIISWLYTIIVVLIGWVFFYYTDLGSINQLLAAMFGIGGNVHFSNATDSVYLINRLPFFIISIVACTPIAKYTKMLFEKLSSKKLIDAFVLDLMVIVFDVVLLYYSTASLVGSSYNPFLYFRF